MDYRHISYSQFGVDVVVSTLAVDGGVDEHHAMFTSTIAGTTFARQLGGIVEACRALQCELGEDVRPVFKRYFLSDAANQAAMLPRDSGCAVSVVEQPPLNGTKIALWVYWQQGVDVRDLYNGFYEVSHGTYRHFWQGSACAPDLHSEVATRALLSDYAVRLEHEGCSLAGNCVRTWFFVQNVDVNYGGVVKARNDVFLTHGLSRDTHYIASTGIGGRHADARVTVEMDAYAVKGLEQGQMGYLYAPDYLNRTYEYGVAFERGTTVDYGDRRQVFVSGTASINNRGEVMHHGDVCRQTLRMWENVHALLAEARCGWDDVAHMIVYLRDIADYAAVEAMYKQHFPHVPRVIVWAPVCRPGWLVEMECMAVKKESHSDYAPF